MFSRSKKRDQGAAAQAASRGLHLVDDPDEDVEARRLAALRLDGGDGVRAADPPRCPFNHAAAGGPTVKLNVVGRTHHQSPATAALLDEIGGVAQLTKMTELFYQRMFADPHLDQFVRDHTDPHAERLADWIAEKMGGGNIWTQKRATRPHKEVVLADGYKHVVHDRSSAHTAAWYSPKRAPDVVGQHFKLNDARNWLRLMFWSARDVGLLQNDRFENWFQRFLAHFVRVYEGSAVEFVRESVRWSESTDRTAAYLAAGNRMSDVHVGYAEALKALNDDEKPGATDWPYEQE